MKKNALTLAEVLVVTFIVAVLVATGIQAFKVNDKSIKYICSNTYYALATALYNATNNWVGEDYANREIFEESVKDEEGNDREISDEEGAQRLCRALVEYINPVEDRDHTCHPDNLIDITADETEFINKPIQFTATNGVRFWISRRYKKDIVGEEEPLYYYFIFADINGTKRPNSVEYRPGTQANGWKTRDPDIFAFVAMSNNYVCPIGITEVEPRYLTARVMYTDNFDGDEILKYSKTSRSIIGAKAEAWGYYTHKKYNGDNSNSGVADIDPREVDPTGTDSGAMDDVRFIDDEKGLSYGDWLKDKIDEDTSGAPENSIIKKVYAFLNGGTFKDYFDRDNMVNTIIMRNDQPIHTDHNPNNTGGYGCIPHNIDPCEVIVDKYIY